MRIIEQIKAAFGWNGHANGNGQVEPELVVPDDEETKMNIELDADAAEAQLEAIAAEQRESVEIFGAETINLRGRFSELLKPEGKSNGSIPHPR